MTLSELFRTHGSDKDAPGGHTYGAVYEALLAPRRDAVRAVLELGVLRGASLRAWRDYFPHATVTGLDQAPPALDEPRIWVAACDVTDPDALDGVLVSHTFDLIVDDASHWFKDQKASFEFLWPRVRPGGLYVIEDVQCLSDLNELRDRGAVVYDLRHECRSERNWDNLMAVFNK